MVDGIFMV